MTAIRHMAAVGEAPGIAHIDAVPFFVSATGARTEVIWISKSS